MKRVRPYPFDRLPRVARNQVEAGRSFRSHLPLEPSAAFAEIERGLGGPLELSLVECFVARARELEPLLVGTVVRLAAGERWALVVIDRALSVAVAGRVLGFAGGELPAPRAPTLVERGAIELVVQLLVEHRGMQVVGVVETEETLGLFGALPDESLVHVLEARCKSPVATGVARIVVPAALAQAVAPGHPRASLLARRNRLASARVRCVVEAARATLDAPLSQLRVGDVVAFDTPMRTSLPVRLRVAQGGFEARIEDERLTITNPYRLYEGAQMADDESSSDQLLRDLPVEIVCELGRVSMNGRELLELAPGAVVPVSRPLAGPIDLTVGGKLVARGELVDVEGDLGVRLTEVLGS